MSRPSTPAPIEEINPAQADRSFELRDNTSGRSSRRKRLIETCIKSLGIRSLCMLNLVVKPEVIHCIRAKSTPRHWAVAT